jgi:hypothetical protein
MLRAGGYYRVTHWNPLYTQMPEKGEWDGTAYRLVHPQSLRGTPIPQSFWMIGEREVAGTRWEFIHPLDELIGGLCDAGFAITRFREPERGDPNAPPASYAHLAAYVPPMLAIMARKLTLD